MLFSFVRISYNQKSRVLLRLVPFSKATLVAVALITLAWLTKTIWRYATLSFLYVFPPSLVVIVFLEVGLWSFNKLRDYMRYKNNIKEYKKRVIKKSRDIKQWYHVFQPSLVIVYLWKLWYITFPIWWLSI